MMRIIWFGLLLVLAASVIAENDEDSLERKDLLLQLKDLEERYGALNVKKRLEDYKKRRLQMEKKQIRKWWEWPLTPFGRAISFDIYVWLSCPSVWRFLSLLMLFYVSLCFGQIYLAFRCYKGLHWIFKIVSLDWRFSRIIARSFFVRCTDV